MQKVINWFTRGKMMLIGFIGSAIFFSSVYFIDVNCKKGMYICTDFHEIIWMLSMVFVPVFLGSILTYKVKEEIFVSWRNFSVVFVLLSSVITIILPFHCDSYLRVCKESSSWLFAGVYFFLSLFVVLNKTLKLK